jgi:membrane associated rhomboid family serine protease
MSDRWGRKEHIEGEYEVLEERDYYDHHREYYSPHQDNYLYMDNSPPYVTYVLLGLNILVYFLMNILGFLFRLNQSELLLYFGAKHNLLIAYGQYWRLFTAMFLHIGILHLFFNSYALYIYGPVVERLFGKFKFTVIYVLSGLTGGLFSYMFSLNPSAGASGAIFGLMGSLLYFRQRKLDIFRRIFGTRLLMIIFINLFYGLVQPGIDNWGHIGGLIGGYLVGNAVGLYKESRFNLRKSIAWILITLIFLFGLTYGKEKYTFKVWPPMPVPRNRGTLQIQYPLADMGNQNGDNNFNFIDLFIDNI